MWVSSAARICAIQPCIQAAPSRAKPVQVDQHEAQQQEEAVAVVVSDRAGRGGDPLQARLAAEFGQRLGSHRAHARSIHPRDGAVGPMPPTPSFTVGNTQHIAALVLCCSAQ